MSGPILWRSTDGKTIANLAFVTCVVRHDDGSIMVTLADGKFPLPITAAEAPRFLAALDAACRPTFMEWLGPDSPDPLIDVDAVIARLDRLRADMATVGGNALVEAVRDLAIAIRGVGRG